MRSVVPSSCSLHSPGRQPDRAAPLTAKATCVVRSCHGHCRFCFFFSVLLTPPDDAPGHRRRHARRGCSSCRGKLCRSCASARGFAVPWTVVVHVDTRLFRDRVLQSYHTAIARCIRPCLNYCVLSFFLSFCACLANFLSPLRI